MNDAPEKPDNLLRLRLTILGAVQGVGFRPFVYRLATELSLKGWVNNSPQGVLVEAEGSRHALEHFLLRIQRDRPPRSFIQSLEPTWLDPAGLLDFEIRASDPTGSRTALVLPDIATCPDCRREIFDPQNRRYRYPFTNCTHCGPRFSIIEALPYDRHNTSMKAFTMCPACQAEYEDPQDRRFHAQPNACPACGPRLALWDANGKPLDVDPLTSAVEALRAGRILAVKGLGGFHLMTAAGNAAAIQQLRHRKQREEKPFALMFPSVSMVRRVCHVSPLEERLLLSPESPIVLLARRAEPELLLPWAALAPHNPYLGVMLPYTPLHHLLLSDLGEPVVATSGNLSDEPICIDEHEAVSRLAGIADLFLVNNRPIVRHVDDSVTRIMAGREMVLRRARGFAPLPVPLPSSAETPTVIAVGAHLKNTLALATANQAFLSQHIGDLETEPALRAFERTIADLERTFEAAPAIIVADAHPDYLSTRYASERAKREPHLRFLTAQHHLAHVLACMAENEVEPPFLGVSWDGTGYGLDGTIWGGEFFEVTHDGWKRVGHFRRFRLPGGEAAIKEPRRTALGVLFEIFGEDAFQQSNLPPVHAFRPAELNTIRAMLQRGLNSPLTSSAGRLFDAVAALAGLRQELRFEGQAAMQLEFAANPAATTRSYPFELVESPGPHGRPWIVNWEPAIRQVIADFQAGITAPEISSRFHLGMANTIIYMAQRLSCQPVLLSGGCFQNRLLTEHAVSGLSSAGFRPYWHQRVPPNDGGIALGQVVAARVGYTQRH